MIVLHYIPTLEQSANAAAAEYVSALVRSTKRTATSHVLTEKDIAGNMLSAYFAIRKRLKEISPDIVHVHGAWDAKAALVEYTAKKMGFFTAVSVHGGLSPDIINLDFLKKKLPRIIAYQYQMVRESNVCIAVSKEDEQHLLQLHWKKRIIVIPHPSYHNISDDQICETIMAAYRKVIDTNYLWRITPGEKKFILECLRAAVIPEQKPDDLHEKGKAISTDGVSFRRIFLFAYDNNIIPLLKEGAFRLGIHMPTIPDMASIPRFKVKKHKNHDKEKYTKLISAIETVIPGVTVHQYDTPSGDTSMQTLCDLYVALRLHDYNEDSFCRIVKDKGIEKFTAQRMYLLQNIFKLEIGYMPMLPRKFNLVKIS